MNFAQTDNKSTIITWDANILYEKNILQRVLHFFCIVAIIEGLRRVVVLHLELVSFTHLEKIGN